MAVQSKSGGSLLRGLTGGQSNVSAQITENFGHNVVCRGLLDARLLNLRRNRDQREKRKQAKRGHADGESDFH